MDKSQKAVAIERLLFIVLLVMLAIGGASYGWFRGRLPDWQLVGLIVAGYVVAYILYRVALNRALKNMGV